MNEEIVKLHEKIVGLHVLNEEIISTIIITEPFGEVKKNTSVLSPILKDQLFILATKETKKFYALSSEGCKVNSDNLLELLNTCLGCAKKIITYCGDDETIIEYIFFLIFRKDQPKLSWYLDEDDGSATTKPVTIREVSRDFVMSLIEGKYPMQIYGELI